MAPSEGEDSSPMAVQALETLATRQTIRRFRPGRVSARTALDLPADWEPQAVVLVEPPAEPWRNSCHTSHTRTPDGFLCNNVPRRLNRRSVVLRSTAPPTTAHRGPAMSAPTSTLARSLSAAALAALLAACAGTTPAPIVQTPGCLSDAQMDVWMADQAARRPTVNPPATMTMADAACTRAKLQQRLAAQSGPLAGYKAGLTNPAVQKRFNTDQPVWGALYERMLLDNGATVAATFGARPLYEADLLVRVKDAGINAATTPAEVLQHVDQIVPFIELPDLVVQAPPQLNGVGVSAINVGARLGVRGAPLAVPADPAGQARLLDQLRDMDVRLVDAQGDRLGGGKGSDVLGHPLNAVVWLAGALKAQGLALQPGQLVSLGSFSALLPPKPGLKATLHYDGVPGLQPVTVTFR